MPAFQAPSGQQQLQALWPGASVDVFSAESVATGELSQALALSNHPQGGGTPTSIDIVFSAAPGAFTFNVVFAAKAVAADFAMPDTTYQLTDANLDVNNNAVHFDIPFSNARFIAIYVESQPANAVTVTATIKR
jgi:hypothetical protein